MLSVNGPRVTSVQADNRGLFQITFDRAISEASATTAVLRITNAGRDGKFGTADDVLMPLAGFFSNGDLGLTLYSPGAAVTRYRLQLISGGLKGANGRGLDGEIGKAGFPSGDGKPGGNFDVVTVATKKLTARFFTPSGNIDVRLYNTATPKTVTNFVNYVNSQVFDAGIFHRLIHSFVLQGGGFRINKHGTVSKITTTGTVKNEPGLHNIRGTIAMAKLPPTAPGGGPDSATDQFFFNLADNSANLDAQNGGFTVFGNVADTQSLGVMDALAASQVADVSTKLGVSNSLGGDFTSTPVTNLTKVQGETTISPAADLVLMNRVTIVQDVAASGISAKAASASDGSVAVPMARTASSLFAASAHREQDWLL